MRVLQLMVCLLLKYYMIKILHLVNTFSNCCLKGENLSPTSIVLIFVMKK